MDDPLDNPRAAKGETQRPWTARDVLAGLLLAALLVLVNDAYVAARVGVLHGPSAEGTGFTGASDHFCYIAMAADEQTYYDEPIAHVPPFCYRVLTPWAAHALQKLGLGSDAAFYLIAQVGLVAFLLGLYLLLIDHGLERRLAALGIVLAAGMQGAVRWYSLQYWMTDPLALAFLVLGVHLVRHRRWNALAATSVLGMLNKDTYVILFGYAFLAELRRAGLKAAFLRTLQVAWLALVVVTVMRTFVVQHLAKGFLDTVRPIFEWRMHNFFRWHLYTASVGSLGAILPLLLLFPGRVVRCVRESYPELALAAGYLATLGVATNTDRELAYTLPALLPLAMLNLDGWLRATRVPFALAAAALVLVQALFWWRTVFTEASIQPVRWDVLGAVATLWALGLGVHVARRRAAPPVAA